jgi:hypothetical protein
MRATTLKFSLASAALMSVCIVAHGSRLQEPAEGTTFGYKFENRRFYVPLIEIDLASDGTGQLRFKRGESDDVIDLKLQISGRTMAHIRRLLDIAGFLDSTEEYQAKKDFSHLGWVTLRVQHGSRSRSVRFNYTTNSQIKELADIFHGIATTEMHVFDLETSQQFQPLDLPRQLDSLEADLRLERIVEPERLLAPLREIAGSDTLPLIARNQARRIIGSIEKGKIRTPARSMGKTQGPNKDSTGGGSDNQRQPH